MIKYNVASFQLSRSTYYVISTLKNYTQRKFQRKRKRAEGFTPCRAVHVQVDFIGLAVIRPHRSSPDRVRQCTPKVSGALTSLDPRWGRSIRALAMSSLSNSSKPRTSCGWVGLGLAGHGCLTPSSVFEHGTRAGGRWDALTDLRSVRQLEFSISRTGAAIATQFAVSTNSSIVMPVA